VISLNLMCLEGRSTQAESIALRSTFMSGYRMAWTTPGLDGGIPKSLGFVVLPRGLALRSSVLGASQVSIETQILES
jgi:hypothetical protein